VGRVPAGRLLPAQLCGEAGRVVGVH